MVAAGSGLLVGALTASPAHGCTCRGQRTIREAAETSDAIFLGRAVTIEWVRPRGGPPAQPSSISEAVTFEVEKRWKGEETEPVIVYTGRGGGDCGRDFEVGQRYVVYATMSQRGEVAGLMTSICNRGMTVSEGDLRSRTEIEELDEAFFGAPSSDDALAHDEIRRLFEAHRAAAREGAATLATSYVCPSVVHRYEMLRALALGATKDELLGGPLVDAIEALELRHRLGASLHGMSGRDIVVAGYEAGWQPRGLEQIDRSWQLGRIRVDGDEALGHGVQDRGLMMENSYRFEREEDRWCIDTAWFPLAVEVDWSLRWSASNRDGYLDREVLRVVESRLRIQVPPAIWTPLAAAAAPP